MGSGLLELQGSMQETFCPRGYMRVTYVLGRPMDQVLQS